MFIALTVVTALLQRLPDGPLHRLAQASGGLLYRAVGGQRRAVARANLAQICGYLAAHDLVQPDSPAALAARDERARERLLRAAFGHYVRTYLEVAIMPAYARADRSGRLVADDPALIAAAFGLGDDVVRPGDTQVNGSRPVLVVALHFGAIEMPALWGARHGLRVTAPMEILADADLQTYLARSRGASGIRLVGQRGAARELTAALARGEVVALVSDRLVAGAGARVELFGRTTRLPIGAAALAVESGAPAWLVTARRTGWGRYRGHLERIETPTEGSRRERMAAFLDAQARAFERAVALAPEQWWTLFFPIWDEPRR